MRLTIFDRGEAKSSVAGSWLHGFAMQRRILSKQFGIRIQYRSIKNLDHLVELASKSRADAAFASISWNDSPKHVSDAFAAIQMLRPDLPMIAIDAHDHVVSNYFDVLPYVAAYWKRQIFQDRWLYQNTYQGGTPITDYIHKEFQIPLDGWHFGVKPSPEHAPKIIAGWNLGVTPEFRSLLRWGRFLGKTWEKRRFDIQRRLDLTVSQSPQKQEWYHQYRTLCIRKFDMLTTWFRCTATERASRRRFRREMLNSRIVISPFGWGEVCLRDFEAICSGALLIKPAMNHIETHPNIYQDYQTYVPVRWDLTDLEEVCAFYLDHPDKSKIIIHQARQTLHNFFHQGGVAQRLEALMPLLGRRLPLNRPVFSVR